MKITIELETLGELDQLVERLVKDSVEPKSPKSPISRDYLISDSSLPVRVSNALWRFGITKLSDLVALSKGKEIEVKQKKWDMKSSRMVETDEVVVVSNLDHLGKTVTNIGPGALAQIRKYIKERI